MAEWILELAVAIAPELFHHGHLYLGAGFHCAIECGVNIFDVDVQTHACPATLRFGANDSEIGKFVGEHDDGVADLQFRVHDLAIWSFHYAAFFGAKRSLVKINRTFSIADGHEWGKCVVSLWNWFHGHEASWERSFSQSTTVIRRMHVQRGVQDRFAFGIEFKRVDKTSSGC